MNKQEVIKQIEELIKEKELMLEGDQLDEYYKNDIDVLTNALNLIRELCGGNA